MQVWKIEGRGSYSSGILVVAAETPAQIEALIRELPPERTSGVQYGPDVVLVEHVTYDGETPTILVHVEFGGECYHASGELDQGGS
jgi:hypothetical protein